MIKNLVVNMHGVDGLNGLVIYKMLGIQLLDYQHQKIIKIKIVQVIEHYVYGQDNKQVVFYIFQLIHIMICMVLVIQIVYKIYNIKMIQLNGILYILDIQENYYKYMVKQNLVKDKKKLYLKNIIIIYLINFLFLLVEINGMIHIQV